MTNFEEIKSMNEEQLAKYIAGKILGLDSTRKERAMSAWRRWLEMEADHDTGRNEG